MTQRGRIPMTHAGARRSALVILLGLLPACGAATDGSPSPIAAAISDEAAPSADASDAPTDAGPSQPGSPPEPMPCPEGVLCPGRIGPGDYAMTLGLAGVRFAVQSDWDADIHPESGFISLFHAGDVPAILGVSEVSGEVFSDPCNDQTTQTLERTPEAFTDWLAQHPAVEMGEPEPVTVGEATGLRFELTTRKDEPCPASTGIDPDVILLWPQAQGAVFLTVDGTTAIFYVLMVGEQLLVVSAETLDEVEPWRALVEPVLASMELVSLTQLRDETALADCVRAFPCRLAAGEQRTEILGATTLTLPLEPGWTAFLSRTAPSLSLTVDRPAPAIISAFVTTGEVFTDPCSFEETTMIEPTVDAVVDWLVEHPQLGAREPDPVTLGGLDGFRIELTTTGAGCAGPYPGPGDVLLFQLPDDFYSAIEGISDVVFVLAAGQEVLIVTAGAPEGGTGLRQIEPLFESMEFAVD